MNSWTKTFTFLGVACVAVGLAFAAHTATRPIAPAGFERIGEEFYPEFDDPLDAKSLRIVSYDAETSIIDPFEITFENGRYRISPYAYPADAEDQLAKTSASIVGIRREGVASRREADFERYGVIDPLSEDATLLQGRGTRITLSNVKGEPIADYIVGKPVEGSGPEGYYYLRKPKEKETYKAKLDLNLTTQFADWIEADLLKLAGSNLQRLEIQNYEFNEQQMTIANRDTLELTRGETGSAWQMEGLDESSQQVNTATVNDLTNTLRELKIIGVRPQPRGLNPDLTLDPKYVTDRLAAQELASSLVSRGFLPIAGPDGNPRLYAKQGQISAVADNGVAYDLYFGEQFSGSRTEIALGKAGREREKQLKSNTAKSADAVQGRYLFVAARYEPTAFGDKPQSPANVDASAQTPLAGDDIANQNAAAQQAEYTAALSAYEKKVADAKAKVAELNDRFKGWYYVISNENFDSLRPSRDDLVSAKAATDESNLSEMNGNEFSAPFGPMSPQSESPLVPTSDQPADKLPKSPEPVVAPRPGG